MHPGYTPQEEPVDEISCSTLSMRDQRSLLLHLLYAIESFDYQTSIESVIDNFARGYGCIINQDDTLYTWATAIVAHRELLDEEIKPLLDNWRFERIGCCTKLILRIAIWELLNTDTSPLVVINEAIELAKCFAETDAYKFINGVLDEWIKRRGIVVEK